MSFFIEIRRRNILRVGVAYAVVAWLLLQVSATLVPALRLPEWFHSGVALLLILGFPVALLFAWAYELPAQGEMKDGDTSGGQLKTGFSTWKLDFVIIGFLVIALGYFVADKFALDPSDNSVSIEASVPGTSPAISQDLGTSIAVLPFVNMSDDASNEYFSDGLSEELLNLLAKIPELRVSARTSSFSFRDQVLEIPVIAERLNVAHVLEGSVRKSGNTIRITAQLIDARTDTHLWSETYDRKLDDVFAIQDEIAADVVGQLKLKLLGSVPKSRTTDPEAFRLYLQGAYISAQIDDSKNDQAESLFRQALELDPEYMPAWRELARIISRKVGSGTSLRDDVENARRALERALQIDPGDAASLAYRAFQIMNYDGDFEQAARLFERAISIDPTNEHVLRSAAIFAIYFARPQDAIALAQYAVDNNPLCFACSLQLFSATFAAGDFDAAEKVAQTMQSFFGEGDFLLAMVLQVKSQPQLALEMFRKVENERERLYWSSLALYDLGQLDASSEAFSAFREASGDRGLWEIASVYAYTDQIDAAFETIELAESRAQVSVEGAPMRLDHISLARFARNPLVRNLHKDPRWRSLLVDFGVSEEQLAAVNFDPEILRPK